MPIAPSTPPRESPKIVQDRTKAPLETYIDARPRKPKAKGRGFVTKPLPALGPTRKSDPAE